MHELTGCPSFEFDIFRIDAVRRTLLKNDEPVRLTAKAFDTLLVLVENHGSTISKGDLMNAVWADSAVEENNLTQQISTLRRVLGERPGDHRFIVTVPGRGYSFVADLKEGSIEPTPSLAQSPTRVHRSFDPAVVRGYSLAFGQIMLIALAFLFSALTSDSTPQQSLAVLDFKVAVSDDEIIGNGISETLRARLGSVEDLTIRVAPADRDAVAAGRKLHVDRVVTGSVQRVHDRIRVAVEMVDVTDGRIVWGKTFDDNASNVFALQDAIAGEVARVLNVKFSSRRTDPSRSHELAMIRERTNSRDHLSA